MNETDGSHTAANLDYTRWMLYWVLVNFHQVTLSYARRVKPCIIVKENGVSDWEAPSCALANC